MNRRTFVASTLSGGAGLAVPFRSFGQDRIIEPPLEKLTGGKGLRVFNRSITSLSDGARRGIRVGEAAGEGLAYLDGIEFASGRIEVDLRGRDMQGQSFLGVAFHGIDGTSYDAVYFRPFNFRTEDPVRRTHAVQYISKSRLQVATAQGRIPGEIRKRCESGA
jgi:hypothetical protein